MSTSSTHVSTPRPSAPFSPSTQKANLHTSHAAYNLLSKAHPGDEETATKIFTEKILHKPLLLSASTDHTNNPRSARRHIRLRKNAYTLRHARPKPLSAKEKRALKLYDLRPEECRYEIYRGLNRLWRRYILEVLSYVDREGRIVTSRIDQPVTVNSGASALASADFHGMEVEVVACVDQGRVGCKGIVVRETRSSLTVVCNEKEGSARKLKRKRGHDPEHTNSGAQPITATDVGSAAKGEDSRATGDDLRQKPDKVRMILKKGTVFRVAIDLPTKEESEARVVQAQVADSKEGDTDDVQSTTKPISTPTRQIVFELHGDQLEIRPIDRAVKKYKWKPTDYL